MGFLRQDKSKVAPPEAATAADILLEEFGSKTAQRSVLDVLDFLPEDFDFYYKIRRNREGVEEGAGGPPSL